MITLTADDKNIPLTDFPAEILSATVLGALSTLRGAENLVAALVHVEGDETTLVTLNGTQTEVNEFVSRYLAAVVGGAASTLRGTEGASRFEVRIA